MNCGHPPNKDLKRVCRLAGASEETLIAVRGIQCSTCRKAAAPRIQRPSKIKESVRQFGEAMLADNGYVKDAKNPSCGILLSESDYDAGLMLP